MWLLQQKILEKWNKPTQDVVPESKQIDDCEQIGNKSDPKGVVFMYHFMTNNGKRFTLMKLEGHYSLSTGHSNTAIGRKALDQTTGNCNTALGYDAGGAIIGGAYNICIGYLGGDNITTGDGNVIIGNVDAASATDDFQLKISGYDESTTVNWIAGDSSGNIIHAGTTHSAGGQLTTTGKAMVLGY